MGEDTPLPFTLARPKGWEVSTRGGGAGTFVLKLERPVMAGGETGRARIAIVQTKGLTLSGPLQPSDKAPSGRPLLLRFGDVTVSVVARRVGHRAAYQLSIPQATGDGARFFSPVEVQVDLDETIAGACARDLFALAEGMIRTIEPKP